MKDGEQFRTLLVIAAEPRELAGILHRAGSAAKLDWPVWYARRAVLNGRQMFLVANGPGPELAAAAAERAIGLCGPDALVSTGYCGALDPALADGEVFVAAKVEAETGSYPAATAGSARPFRTGTLASVRHLVATVEDKRRLHEHGAAVVEMEAAALAAAARRHGLPFYCIRAVMDRADEGFVLDFDSLRGADGRYSRSRILKAALGRPFAGIPELFRLVRRGRQASRALGDFVADCGF